ncbi:hypothetical protein L484_022113 [Morus notabilis]|uniref:Uncharacterized protein n=1 Tax=Morus notabilis TaxID=981085 RepID=W9QYY8_9ROSA|nr:hypothetical protein L484_022113 [Morus notabilis]
MENQVIKRQQCRLYHGNTHVLRLPRSATDSPLLKSRLQQTAGMNSITQLNGWRYQPLTVQIRLDGLLGLSNILTSITHLMSSKSAWAVICMEGSALHWIQWIRKKDPSLSWEVLVAELIRRYCGRKASNPYERLTMLRQTGSVA